MTLNKRFLLITTMALVILAAIAFGPAYKRTFTHVRAAKPSPAVVVLECDDAFLGLYTATSSDPSVTLPALASLPSTPGASCAQALQDIVSQGFSIYPINTSAIGLDGTPSAVWTLVRPSQSTLPE